MITRAAPETEVSVAPATRAALSERALPALLFALTFTYLLVFRRVTNMDPDEGIVLQGAERILHGQVPYRDFFTFYTPGSFYLTAFTLNLFGDTLAVARTVLVLFGAIFPVVTYALARRTCSREVALLVAVLTAMTAAPYRFMVLHNWDSTFWACLCVYCTVRWTEAPRAHGFAFATGSFASFTFLFEQSKGVGLCLGILLGIVILRFFGHRASGFRYIAIGFAWPLAVTIAYFDAHHALRSMLHDLLWPLHHYSTANRVFYGDQSWSDHARDLIFHQGPIGIRTLKAVAVSPGFVVPVLPLIALGLLFYWVRRYWTRSDDSNLASHYVLMCSILCGLLFSVVIVRADIVHFMYLAPLFYLVLAWIVERRAISSSLFNKLRPWIIFYVIVAFGLMGVAMCVSAAGARDRLQTRRGVVFTREPDNVLPFVMRQTELGEKVLVYPYLPLYYYLSATQGPSPYDFFQPGMSDSQQAQEIIMALDSAQVQTVLFEPAFADKIPTSWPGTPDAVIAHDAVADYIVHNYKTCASLRSSAGWNFLFMRRRGTLCP